MNILHITLGIPQLRAGGLITYAYSIARMEKKLGHNVSILYPGHYDFFYKKSRIKKVHDMKGFFIYELINPSFVAVPLGVEKPELFMTNGNKCNYNSFLNSVKPDLIHIHTFMGFHGSLFEILKNYPSTVVYTTHDYYTICPKTSKINEKNELCNCVSAEACVRCNSSSHNSMLLQYVLQSRWYPRLKKNRLLTELKKQRKKIIRETTDSENGEVIAETFDFNTSNVEQFKKLLLYFKNNFSCVDIVHCNSSITEMVYKDYIQDKKHFILNITANGIKDHRKESRKLPYHQSGIINIGFIGIRDFHKGYWLLRDAGKVLYEKGYQFTISFYGDEFNIDKAKYPFCNEMGMFPHEKISEVMSTIDLMVVPAFWFETFGFATLEAIANGVPVLASSHTGAKDLLSDIEDRHIFEPDYISLAQTIEYFLQDPLRLDEEQEIQNKLSPVFSLKEHTIQLLRKIEIEGEI